jgi:serine/threonine protein kinase
MFEDKKQYVIVSELISGGNLLNIMEKQGRITEKWAAKVIKQTLLALNYMHQKGIMHRDVKLENLLCLPQQKNSDELEVKLTDFGFATHFKAGEEEKILCLGSGLYMSPELVSK